jgi:hypothetical protein
MGEGDSSEMAIGEALAEYVAHERFPKGGTVQTRCTSPLSHA